ncbi:MAG TPA: nitronate monooxygenase [Microthrixaceae bacterium]|nr:nitronate monooxygenase [Microthrixaceae bacterium]
MSVDMISTPLTELLGVRHPILLAPMEGVAGGVLAAEVSAAGAFGQIGGGYCDIETLRNEISLAKGARVGIGFITFALDERPEALDIALASNPPSVQLSFGDPRRYDDRIHDAGALLICGVQTPDEVALALEAGADVIVAQGREAGGHGRPDLGTMGLIPSVVDRAGSTPVVAAGGIADGRGLAAALMLGASGITMGTRFLATHESISNPVEAAELVARSSVETVRTSVYDVVRGPAWPEGHDGRVVRNDFTTSWAAEPDHPQSQVENLRDRYKGSRDADYSIRPLWAGEGLDLITSIEPAASVVEAIIAEASDALAKAGSFIRQDS